jgi:hypothetical protein
MRTRRLAIAGAAALAMALAVGLALRPEGEGHLYLGEPGQTTESGSSSDVNGTVVWGAMVLKNTGRTPLTIRRIVLNPDGDVTGVKIEGIYVLDLAGNGGAAVAGMARQWPPDIQADARFVPAAGAVLQPDRAHPAPYQMLVRMTVDKIGRWRFGSFTVYYESAGHERSATHEDAVVLCTPLEADCSSQG